MLEAERAGELLLGLRYFRNRLRRCVRETLGELLLGLRYFRNGIAPVLNSVGGELLLDYGTSETYACVTARDIG